MVRESVRQWPEASSLASDTPLALAACIPSGQRLSLYLCLHRPISTWASCSACGTSRSTPTVRRPCLSGQSRILWDVNFGPTPHRHIAGLASAGPKVHGRSSTSQTAASPSPAASASFRARETERNLPAMLGGSRDSRNALSRDSRRRLQQDCGRRVSPGPAPVQLNANAMGKPGETLGLNRLASRAPATG